MAQGPLVYDTLPLGSIRILTVLPGSPSSKLRCTLGATRLLTAFSMRSVETSFEALSYTWGETVNLQRVTCNESELQVTQNLFQALVQLRYENAPRTLWVDAICINQEDLDEKSKQIPLMKFIYAYAERVIIWLGPADETTSKGLSLVDHAARCLRRETGLNLPLPGKDKIPPERFDDERNCARGFPSKTELGEWMSLMNLFERKWFTRCWVFQESALATAATVQVGHYELDWADLCVASTFFSYKSYSSIVKGHSAALLHVFNLCSSSRIGSGAGEFRSMPLAAWIFGFLGVFSFSPVRPRFTNFRRMPLIELLISTYRFQATDPKDKVFAVLGLAEEEVNFPVDYKMSLEEICTNVSRLLLLQQARSSSYSLRILKCLYTWASSFWSQPYHSELYPLQVLSYVKHYPDACVGFVGPHVQQVAQFPSWVARWHEAIPEVKLERDEDEVQPMFAISGLPSSAKFFAGGTDYPGVLIEPATPKEISLEGFVFGTISHGVNFLRLPPLSRPRLWDLVLDIRSVREDRNAPYPTGESIDEAFALTLTMADTTLLTVDAKAETYHAIDFQHFCVSLYEQTVRILTKQEHMEEVEHLKKEWDSEYQRLNALVGGHTKSPKFSPDLQISCLGRKVFSTSDGYVGVGDVTLEPGDLVCVLFGGKIPFILRPVDGKFRLVGECYLHGIMLGEALEEGRKDAQRFTLV